MRNPVIIGVLIAVVLVAAGLVVKDKINNQNEITVTLGEKQEQKNQLQPSSALTPTQIISTTSNEKENGQETPYSVEIKSTPTYNFYGFTYKVTLKNILVKPFITNFGFSECNFSDGNGNKYSGMISDGNAFEKAILPNESREFTVKDVNINISGLEHISEGLRKCSYNEKGENVCKLINDLKLIDCIGYISTDGKGAGGSFGGTGDLPINVMFPTL